LGFIVVASQYILYPGLAFNENNHSDHPNSNNDRAGNQNKKYKRFAHKYFSDPVRSKVPEVSVPLPARTSNGAGRTLNSRHIKTSSTKKSILTGNTEFSIKPDETELKMHRPILAGISGKSSCVNCI
jgi:hypothetical protein